MTRRVLVPFELPDADPLPTALVDHLSCLQVVVLGHFRVPEQTPLATARAQYMEAAEAEVDSLARPFEERHSLVSTRVVFGKRPTKTVDRVAREENCDAELYPAPAEGISRILVPLDRRRQRYGHRRF